jgi:predicted DsbA family dithiol-disulfide isomerase
MSRRPDLDFDVRWYPFQLNPQAPQESSKLEMYMQKFGISKEEAMQKAAWMQGKFEAANLPFSFKETDKTGNTFDAHRLLTAAFQQGGSSAQDQAAEKLFHGYFADGIAPSDPALLKAAAKAAGMDGDGFLADKSISAAETREELGLGKRLNVRGVPHFVIYDEQAGTKGQQQLSGAQPPEQMLAVLNHVARP